MQQLYFYRHCADEKYDCGFLTFHDIKQPLKMLFLKDDTKSTLAVSVLIPLFYSVMIHEGFFKSHESHQSKNAVLKAETALLTLFCCMKMSPIKKPIAHYQTCTYKSLNWPNNCPVCHLLFSFSDNANLLQIGLRFSSVMSYS